MPMAMLTFGLAVVLFLIGMAFGVTKSADAGMTPWIPAIVSIPFFILGAIALTRHRMHAMHAAVVLALLGLIGIGMRLPALLEGDNPRAMLANLLVVIALLLYLILAIRSFIMARRSRRMSTGTPSGASPDSPPRGEPGTPSHDVTTGSRPNETKPLG